MFSPSVSSCRVFHLYLRTLAVTRGHKIRTKVNSSPEWVGFSCLLTFFFPLSQKELVLPIAAELEEFLFLAVCYKWSVVLSDPAKLRTWLHPDTKPHFIAKVNVFSLLKRNPWMLDHFLNPWLFFFARSRFRKHVHGGLLWWMRVHPPVQTVLRVNGRIQVPLVSQCLLPMHRTWMRGLWQQGRKVHELSALKCGRISVPNIWTITEDWEQRKLWLLCVSIPQLPCKISPASLRLSLQTVFILLLYFTVYFFLEMFSIVFFFFLN